MTPQIHIDEHPSEHGWAVSANDAAEKILPNFPSHIGFWGFKRHDKKGAVAFARKIAGLAAGVTVVSDTPLINLGKMK